MSDVFPEDIPEPVQAEIARLYQPAIEALQAALGADRKVRLDLTCPGCQRRFRKTVETPEPKSRLDAAKFIAEQSLGRAAPKKLESDADEDRIIFERIIYMTDADNHALVNELADAGLITDRQSALAYVAALDTKAKEHYE